MFFKSFIIFSWIWRFISSSMFCSSRTWFFIIISMLTHQVPKKSRFYFDLILLGIYSRIFLVVVILYINCKFVIYFFSMFFCVLSFNVWIVLLKDLIYSSLLSGSSLNSSDFFIIAIYPCLFLISNILRAFCSSISMRALLNWILSLKFSKISSLIFLISSFSSIFPQMQNCPSFLISMGSLYYLKSFYGSERLSLGLTL